MDVKFLANQLRPDDPNYVWDKRIDFEPAIGDSCDWDEEDEDD